ncbi:MerR family transcriptional regulator [Leucobacter chromiiresistens]|uniref:MerR family transcriptional regulator n=1 Tax=Leucobacter chromiiresistens TaxID=1079994 RepID=A0A147EM13_9MICO|nr:TipAS antibiotic-recognition domain-containing protein [Leucobacter chromiiresistens]KTR85509.1 MerR family transcriptional regulator [Leucobacter chromiiresistens]
MNHHERLHAVQAVARAAGTTSRTLRHYDRIGLLPPTRVGANGYRYYDDGALLRLQRILLLRELGLGLDAIARVLAAQDAHGAGADHGAGPDHGSATSSGTGARVGEDRGAPPEAAGILRAHLAILQGERERVDRQIGAVERTIAALLRQNGTPDTRGALMSENIFDGFDQAQHRAEVERRWGARAADAGDRWWGGLDADGRAAWQRRSAELGAAWADAARRGEDPAGAEAQALAARHVAWLRGIPGTPAADPAGDAAGYVRGLGELYVADERFAANYGGQAGAEFVRDALRIYADAEWAAEPGSAG